MRKYLSPIVHNNRVFADLLTLKFNISISASGITTPGFGELRFVESGNPFDNMLIRDIAKRADSLMTFILPDIAVYKQLDSTLQKINGAFFGPIDTFRIYADYYSIRLKGVKRWNAVPFLQQSGVAPTIVPGEDVPVDNHNEPFAFRLYQNYPNPFNPLTTIEFSLAEPGLVTLKIYNLLGQEVRSLLDNEMIEEGEQSVDFDGGNLPSGVYFYRLTAGKNTEMKKMLYLR
jgi:Secretion system C-terminal sorting domain